MNIFSVILILVILVILAILSIVYSFFFSTPIAIGIALGTTLLGVGLLLYLWVRHDLSHH